MMFTLDCSPVLFGASTKVANIFCLITVIVIFYFKLSQTCYLLLEIHSLIYLNLSSFGRAFILLEEDDFLLVSTVFHLLQLYAFFLLLCFNFLVILMIKCKNSEFIFIKFYLIF